jgi:hypothetical protein
VVKDEAQLKALEYLREVAEREDQIRREDAELKRQAEIRRQEAKAEEMRIAQADAERREADDAKRMGEMRVREEALAIQLDEVDTKDFEVLIRKLYLEVEGLKSDLKRLPSEIQRIETDRDTVFSVLKSLSSQIVTNMTALSGGGVVMRESEKTLAPDEYIKAISANDKLQAVLARYGDDYMVKTSLRELLTEFESSYERLKMERNLLDKNTKAFESASKTTGSMIAKADDGFSAVINKTRMEIRRVKDEITRLERQPKPWNSQHLASLRDKEQEVRDFEKTLKIYEGFQNTSQIQEQQKKTTEIGVDGSYAVHAMTMKNTYDDACRRAVDGARTVILGVVNDSHKQKTKELKDTQDRLDSIQFLLDAHKNNELSTERKRVYLGKLRSQQNRADDKMSSLLFDEK